MYKYKPYTLLFLFPLLYLLTDILFRYQHIVYYSCLQFLFYTASVIFSFLVYLTAAVYMSRHRGRSLKIRAAGLIAASYFTFSIFTAYSFKSVTGIFLNYYTIAYIKQEPSNAVSLIIDSLYFWHFLIFSMLVYFLFSYLVRVSETEPVRKLSEKIKLRYAILTALIILFPLVYNIGRADQCMIADTNLTADLSAHLFSWSGTENYRSNGLPERTPVSLPELKRRPDFNVLVIIFESLRAQNMGVYGYHRETTPFLGSLLNNEPDSLFLFNNAFTVSTTTMLAVPAILSGAVPDGPVEHYSTFPLLWEFAAMLKYNTFFISSHGMAWYRFDRFYRNSWPDFYWNRDTSGLPFFNDLGVDDRITAGKLTEHIAELKGKPFFGVIQFNTNHFPYIVPEEYIRWAGKYIDRYDNTVLYQDTLLKKIFNDLKRLNVYDNTVVIMVGDHGEAFKEHNSIGHIDTLNIETIQIPLIVYIPETLRNIIHTSGLRANTQNNVVNTDIVPTVIDLLELEKHPDIIKLTPLYSGHTLFQPVPRDRSIVTINSGDMVNFNTGVSLLHGDLHYILRSNIVPLRRELYNIRKDPSENYNIAGKSGPSLLEPLNKILEGNQVTAKIFDYFYLHFNPGMD